MTSSTNVPVRHRLTSKQRQQLLGRFHQSQMTRKDFADRHGVGLSTLSKWLKRERLASAPRMKFQEVVLPAPTTSWTTEVVSPKGWIVRLQNGADAQMLPQLLRALPC